MRNRSGFLFAGRRNRRSASPAPATALLEARIIYQRTDVNGIKGEYYGQAESETRYATRQVEEGKEFPDSIFSFREVNSANAGDRLDFMEQIYITANGGAKSQNPLTTELSNWNRVMSDERFGDFLFNTTAFNGIGGTMGANAMNSGAILSKH